MCEFLEKNDAFLNGRWCAQEKKMFLKACELILNFPGCSENLAISPGKLQDWYGGDACFDEKGYRWQKNIMDTSMWCFLM